MQTQTRDIPLHSPAPSSSSDLQREKMNLPVCFIDSHSFVGAAASHNGTKSVNERTVCVMTELSGLVLIGRCWLMYSRLSVQKSAKSQTLKNFPKQIVCSDQTGLLYMHFNSARMQPDWSYATRTNIKKDCVEVCVYMYTHLHTHTVGSP